MTTTAISVYDNIQDPLGFVEKMGTTFSQSGVAGVKTPAQGKVLALACIAEKLNPFEIDKRYHLIGGKLSMRPDAMLGELMNRGGKFTWIKQGDDGTAELEIEYKGSKLSTTYSMEDAKQAKLVKSGGGWEKNPDAMLRARVTSKLMRMIAPDIVSGMYTPEETEEFTEEAPKKKSRSKKEVEARKKELAEAETEVAVEVPDSEIIETEVVEAKTEDPPFETEEPAPETDEIDHATAMISLEEFLKSRNVTLDDLAKKFKKSKPDFESFEKLTGNEIAEIEDNIRTKLNAKK